MKRKTLLSACSRIHDQNIAVFAPSLLKIRARRFVLCLYSHNYFEQEIKNAAFSLSLLRFLDHMFSCVLGKMTTLRAWIGPLKCDDNSSAVKDTEKASLMNCFFSKIAEKLNSGQLQAPQLLTSPCSIPVPCISDINLSSLDMDRKLTLLKNKKSHRTGWFINQIIESC